jgi:hypothetical protein
MHRRILGRGVGRIQHFMKRPCLSPRYGATAKRAGE